MQFHLLRKIVLVSLAAFGLGRAVDHLTRDVLSDLRETPRTMVYLPTLTLDEAGVPLPIQRNTIEISTREKLTMQQTIDASKAGSKPNATAVIMIRRKSQAGVMVIMDSRIARRFDDGGSKFTYWGDLNAPKRPGECSIVFRQRGKEIYTHPLLVVEAR